MLRSTVGLVFMALLFTTPAAGAAATRYVGNPGGGAAPCKDPQQPCLIFTAIDAADPGDTISIRKDPNPYSIPGGLSIDKALHLVGEPGSRPIFQFSSSSGLVANAPGTELRHLRIETSADATAVNAPQRATLADLDIAGTGTCVRVSAPDSVVSDSTLKLANSGSTATCLAAGPAATGLVLRRITAERIGPGAAIDLDAAGIDASDLTVTSDHDAIHISGGAGAGDAPTVLRRVRARSNGLVALTVNRDENGGPLVVSDALATAEGASTDGVITRGAPVLRNVTGISNGPSPSYGLLVVSQNDVTPAAAVVRNSVFRGDSNDISVDPGHGPIMGPGGLTIPGTYRTPLTLTHSNFRNVQGELGPGSGNNQSADPLFVDTANGDFHPLAGSPLIDAGIVDSAIGPMDLDGSARVQGAAPDIGAYETVPPAPPGGGSTVPGSPVPPGASADLTPPDVRELALTNRTFAVGSVSTPVAARAKRGTTFRLTVNEKATIRIAFERSEPGRRKGRRCVKPTRKNRKARKCKRWVPRGSIQRLAGPGPVEIAFSGRIGTKALQPGSYRALVTAQDAAGNTSAQNTLTFKVVKR
jgi:hypothetical protein